MGAGDTGVNPKDALGAKKVSLTKLPAVAVAYGNLAMEDGALKYGPYNWRSKKIIASVYVDACKRHLDLWFEGQENASDSKVPNLAHALACISLLIDSQVTGNLQDDRPVIKGEDGKPTDWFETEMNRLKAIKELLSANKPSA